MAWVDILDDLFGLPVTSGAVVVLEGRQCAPGDALGRPHHSLESHAVAGGEVSVPGGDTARQDALKFLQPPEVEKVLLRHLHHTVCVDGQLQIVSDVYLRLLTFSTAVPSMWMWVCSLFCLLKSTIRSFVLLTLRERLFSWRHTRRKTTSHPTST